MRRVVKLKPRKKPALLCLGKSLQDLDGEVFLVAADVLAH